MKAAIKFDDVSKGYGGENVIEHMNLEIGYREFITIIGSSGSGKTTALKMINGLLLPDEGVVTVEGHDTRHTDLIELRRNIGYAIQGVGLFPHMTVEKNIAYVPSLLNKQDKERTHRAVRSLMDVMGLDSEFAQRYPSELSGGQQQRVGIARALAARPSILLMDEPFGAVDEITRRKLQDEILHIHHELQVTIVFVTHDIREALKLGTRVVVMNERHIVQSGTPAEVTKNPDSVFVEELLRDIEDINTIKSNS